MIFPTGEVNVFHDQAVSTIRFPTWGGVGWGWGCELAGVPKLWASRIDELLVIACRREQSAFGLAVVVPSTLAFGLTIAVAIGCAFALALALAWSRAWQVPRPGGLGVDKYHNPWKQ